MKTPRSSTDPFVEAVREAIRRSLVMVQAAHPGEELNGFALCTDDDLSTLYHVLSRA